MIKDKISQDLIKALKERDSETLKVLRFIKSEINYAEIDKKKELLEEEIILLLRKEIKKRKDAIELFKKNDRNDLVDTELRQINKIYSYLPQEMDSKDIEKVVDDVIKSMSEIKNIGVIIKEVISRTKGQADTAIIANIVKNKLLKFK